MFRPSQCTMSISNRAVSFCLKRFSACSISPQRITTRTEHQTSDREVEERTSDVDVVVNDTMPQTLQNQRLKSGTLPMHRGAYNLENLSNPRIFHYEFQQNVQHELLSSTWQKAFHTSRVVDHSHAHHRNCWNCGRDTSPVTELFFCDCGIVQKPASELTYFDLMQFEPSFDIDTKQLGDMFRETQKRLHPDKFSTKSEEEVKLAQEQSALLNRAYNTLQKPLSRAIYLLELQNIEISENDNFSDPEFLMEIMEINEAISNAKKSSDVESLEVKNDARIAECVKEISELFKKKLLSDMKNATIKLRYYTTIQERINELKRKSLGDIVHQ